jgi:hypothetical protein
MFLTSNRVVNFIARKFQFETYFMQNQAITAFRTKYGIIKPYILVVGKR